MNRLEGSIAAVQSSDALSLVDIDVGGDRFSALVVETPQSNPHLRSGRRVRILFKETEVSIAKGLTGGLSCRNRLGCTIRAIETSPVLAKLTLDYRGTTVVSIITTRSAEALGLQVGDSVEGIVKSNEITIREGDA